MKSEKVKPSAFLVQALATLSISFLTTLIGFVFAWPSYTLANLRSNETVLSAPMTSMEISLLGSLTNIGAFIATPFCGYAISKLGRKYSQMLFGLPFVIAWLVIYFTTRVPLVLTAIGFAGIGVAGQTITTLYIAEISQDAIRGALTSSMATGYFAGLLLSYSWGGCLSYHQVVYVHLGLSILYVLILMLLKESPVFLLQQGRENDAAKSIAFYRRVDITSKEVESEIKKIKLQLAPKIDKGDDTITSEKLINNEPNDIEVKANSAWQFLLKSESSKRALVMCLIVIIIKTFMGAIVLQVYAEPLFKEAVPSMPPNQCAIFLAIDFVVASAICSVLMDRVGRKSLMTLTSIGSGVCTLLLGTQLLFHYSSHWYTAFLIYGFSFVYNVGAATVPFVLTAEVFLPEVRSLCNSIVMGCMWMVNFVALVIFHPLVESLGLGIIFCGFSVVCFFTAFYSHFYIPETKGLSADIIQLLFVKELRKPTVQG